MRVRPYLNFSEEDSEGCVKVYGNQIAVGEKRQFAFDTVLDMDATREDVYSVIGRGLCEAFLSGLNVSVIAYGQTGAGKTFTMADLSSDFLDQLFHQLEEEGERLGENGLSMKLSVVEVYNESLGDLLDTSSAAGGGSTLQLRDMAAHKGVHISGLTEVDIHDRESLQKLVGTANANRKTASTALNASSSRSHCVVMITLTRKGTVARCSLVDLAGSERLKRTFYGPDNDSSDSLTRAREGININGGLLALGNVIVALCDKKAHIPFRSSKLTRLLQPVLSGNCKTAMVACVSPTSFEETLNTLKYADRAKQIRTHPHLVVSSTTSQPETEQVILALRKEIRMLQQQLSGASPQGGAGAGAGRPPLIPRHGGIGDDGVASPTSIRRELLDVQALLVVEQNQTKRLEDELFHAEYTAMIETEKRKSLEDRVQKLEAAAPSLLAADGSAAIEELQREQENLLLENERLEKELSKVSRPVRSAEAELALMELVREVERQKESLTHKTGDPVIEAEWGRLDTIQSRLEVYQQARELNPSPPPSSSPKMASPVTGESVQKAHTAARGATGFTFAKRQQEGDAGKLNSQEGGSSSSLKAKRRTVVQIVSDGPASTEKEEAARRQPDAIPFLAAVLPVATSSFSEAQIAIEEGLKELEKLEREIRDVSLYRASLNEDKLADEGRITNAVKGYRKQLTSIVHKIQNDSISEQQLKTLMEERKNVEERLKTVEAYRHSVIQIRLEIDEVDRRLETLNDAQRFHMRRVVRLQNAGSELDAGYALPSVREISDSRGAALQER